MNSARARTAALTAIGVIGCCWMIGRSGAAEIAVAAPAPEQAGAASSQQEPPAAAQIASSAGGPIASSTSAGLLQMRDAWRAPARTLDERVGRTRRAALEIGVWNLDPAARELPGGPASGSRLQRARAAVALAPDLPKARMALAKALWMEGDSPIAAVRTVGSALAAIPRHLEASLWFAGTGLYVAAIALCAGGLLCLAIAAAGIAPHAAHDLGDALSLEMPAFARAAFLAAVLLVPLALGQGLLGLALGLLAVATLYGGRGQQVVLAAAAVAVLVGAYPVARLAGAVLSAYGTEPALEAALSATEGFASPVDVRRLEAAPETDPLMVHARATTARRAGNLGVAAATYQQLLELSPDDPVAANNAANVQLGLDHVEVALDLYRRSSELRESSAVLFNLSQGYGQAFQVDELNRALGAAQDLDGDLVAELTHLQGIDPKGFTVDVPVPRGPLWRRILRAPAGEEFATEFRAALAPGLLGGDWRVSAGAFAVVALLSAVAGGRFRTSHWCARCGRRLCVRCDPEFGGEELCEGCTRLFHQPETTDRALRLARINALRERDQRLGRVRSIASVVIPGAAGLLARRYWCSLIGALAAAVAVASIVCRVGVVADPLVAGAAAPVVFGAVTALAALGYALAVTMALSGRRI